MTTDHNEAMRLAGELVAPIGTQTSYQTAHEAAALLRKQSERIAELEAERDKWKSAEHALSESYVCVRAAIGAMCPPSLETAELWAYVEATAQALTAERDQLRAEVERLRVDAERYQWLRDNHKGQWAICEDNSDGLGYYRDTRLPSIVDAAIDTARKATQ